MELEVFQKEEILLKTKADSDKQEESLKSEIKKLKEQLKETSEKIENSNTTALEEALKAAEEKSNKALNELQVKKQKEQKMG